MKGNKNISDFGFKKGQSGNPEGRPKKKYKQQIEEIKKLGYEVPTRSEYCELLGLLMAMEEDDVIDFSQDKKRPYWMRSIAMDLLDSSTRQKLISENRDWIFGKAGQHIDHTTKGKSLGEDTAREWIKLFGQAIKVE